MTCTVVARDERGGTVSVAVDVERWADLAEAAATHECADGELSLTFVDADTMARLNLEHMGQDGPTDVLSFPMDDEPMDGVPLLLGDIVICPEVALGQSAAHAGTLDDELALLVVHGLLHVLGHDHAEPGETRVMRERELQLLSALHWGGPPPTAFRQAQD